MRLLPSEKKAAIKKAIQLFAAKDGLIIHEPCDCGSHIRHNNGGNYHEIIYLKRDLDKFFVQNDCTSELEPPSEWKEISRQKVFELIEEYSDWL